MSKEQMFKKLVEAKAAAKLAESEVGTAQHAICQAALADLLKAFDMASTDHPVLLNLLKPDVMYASNSAGDWHKKRPKRPIQAAFIAFYGHNIGWDDDRETCDLHTTFVAGVQQVCALLKEMGWSVSEPDFRIDGSSAAAWFMN